MTALAALLARQIAATGPITLAEYMGQCLGHPEHGYYTTRDPLGASGDFTTAPEISQMFGELIGLCLAQAWLDQGQAARITLAELGPGRGTLMADALRATAAVPGFHDAAQVHLVETSPPLRAAQARAVPGATFHDTVDTLPDAPLFLVANEFFDALPIRQFRRDAGGWAERMIGAEGARLVPGEAPPVPLALLQDRLEDTRPGDIVELCPQLAPIVSQLGARIARQGGACLIIDYGDWTSLGETLQALRGHEPVDPFNTPGEADLTAHVDFAAVARAAAPARYSKLTPQGVFLERLGLTARAQALAARLTGDARVNVVAAHRRLSHPDEMGALFKVIGLYTPHTAPPPGLEP